MPYIPYVYLYQYSQNVLRAQQCLTTTGHIGLFITNDAAAALCNVALCVMLLVCQSVGVNWEVRQERAVIIREWQVASQRGRWAEEMRW